MASVPVSKGVISGNTCIYIQNTCKYIIYIRIHAYTYIYMQIHVYMHIHAHTCIYIHIHAYTCIYIHIHDIHTYTDTIKLLSGGDFEGVQPTPSGVWMDANRLGPL